MATFVNTPVGFTKVVVPAGGSYGEPSYSHLKARNYIDYNFILDPDWEKLADNNDRSTHKLLGIRDCLNREKVQLGLRVNIKGDGTVRFKPVHYQHRKGKIIFNETFDMNLWLHTALEYNFKSMRLPDNRWQSTLELISTNAFGKSTKLTDQPVNIKPILFCNPYVTGVYVELGSSPSPVELTTYIRMNNFY